MPGFTNTTRNGIYRAREAVRIGDHIVDALSIAEQRTLSPGAQAYFDGAPIETAQQVHTKTLQSPSGQGAHSGTTAAPGATVAGSSEILSINGVPTNQHLTRKSHNAGNVRDATMISPTASRRVFFVQR